ncbi:MoxR family ATPase [Pseudonocardia phyllosphaerae]|uniref:hypothetical protein n=1 Tax=Pseudonocardia phyllosphaerae TaxID=3390502 RepID=UPI003979B2B1
MTTYAYDDKASSIIATWPTGDGAVAERVARVPRQWDPDEARRLAGALTRLSQFLWLAYSELTADELHPFRLVEAVRFPNRPAGGTQAIMGDPQVEAAHVVGRLVAAAPGRALHEAVVRDVRAEIDAVLLADDGILDGRSRQGVAHVRPVASEDQLTAAHALLHDDPVGPPQLLTDVEPCAAAIAALRWLQAAAEHVAALVGHTPDDVIALAEAIGHEDLHIAHDLLDARRDRVPAEDVVRDRLEEAVLAGRGMFVVCPVGQVPVAPGDPHKDRLINTLLAPSEPGKCLLDGLLRGLHGCFRVYLDEITGRPRPGDDRRLTEHQWLAELRTRYTLAVREQMRPVG